MQNRLASEYDALSKRLQQVANYVRDHPESVAVDTLHAIAGRAGVPPSTLIRFANHFGFGGFSELQRLYKADVQSSYRNYRQRIRQLKLDTATSDGTYADKLLREFVEADVQALNLLLGQIGTLELERAIQLLHQADTVYLCGLGRAFPVATYMMYSLSHVGARVDLISGTGMMHQEQSRMIGPDDTLVVITWQPTTSATLAIMQQAAEAGARILLLSDYRRSPAAQLATHAIFLDEADVHRFRSLNATMCVAQTLCIGLGYFRESGATAT